MGRIISTLWESINHPRYLANESIARRKGRIPEIADPLSTLQHIRNGISLARFGDCEFNYIMGRSIPQQKSSNLLKTRLMSILDGSDSCPSFSVGIPYVMATLDGFTKESKQFWLKYLANNRAAINQYLNFDLRYYDSQISRFWINRESEEYSEQMLFAWKQIWKNKRVLLVEGEHSRFGVGNDLLDNVQNVKRILCPSENAFFSYDQIKAEALKHAADCDLALLVLGPTATVLAYDLAQEGIWAIDSGNMDIEYEWFRLKTKKKVRINNKSSIEMEGGTAVENIVDLDYESQIVSMIRQS